MIRTCCVCAQEAIKKQEEEEAKAKAEAEAEGDDEEEGFKLFGLSARTLIAQLEELFELPALAPVKAKLQPLFDVLEEHEALIFAIIAIPVLLVALPVVLAVLPKVNVRSPCRALEVPYLIMRHCFCFEMLVAVRFRRMSILCERSTSLFGVSASLWSMLLNKIFQNAHT
jgi:hypothetical protein